MELDPSHDAVNVILRVEAAAERKGLPPVGREWIMKAITALERVAKPKKLKVKVQPLKLFQVATELEAAAATKH